MDDITGLGKVAGAMASVFNNVVDKIASATGVLYRDCDYKIRKDAEKRYIDNIMEDKSLDNSVKMALVSNHKQMFKQYKNQENITRIALDNIKEDTDVDGVDDDWLSYFYDNTKNISNKNIQLVWGNILANEFNNPDSVPKSLIHVLSIISNEDANAFALLCRYTVKFNDGYILFFIETDSEITSKQLNHDQLVELDKLGLVVYTPLNSYIEEDTSTSSGTFEFVIYNKKYSVDSWNVNDGKTFVELGDVILTNNGRALCKAINPIPSERLHELFISHFNKAEYTLSISDIG